MAVKKVSNKALNGSKNTNKKVEPVPEAESHVVVEKFNKETGEKDILKDKGRAIEAKDKVQPANFLASGQCLVGLAKGATINMGNYQSARIDCWISRVCSDNEKSIMDNLANIGELLDSHIEYESSNLDVEE